MEMHQVRYVLAVTRLLNFTRAAEECNVSQPSLTRAVKLLEDEFGEELFRRERNLTHLTEFGRRIVPFLQQCYDSAAAAKTFASSVKRGAVAPLTLAISHSLRLSLIIAQLAELDRAFPGLELHVVRGAGDDVAAALKKGDADLALCGPMLESWDRLESWPLFTERLHVAVGKNHRLAKGGPIAIEDLRGESLITQIRCEMTQAFAKVLRSREALPRVSHVMTSEEDYLVALAAGLGVGLLPESAARAASVARVAVANVDLERTVYLYAASGRQRTVVVDAFMKLLRSADWEAQLAELSSS